MDFDFSLLLLDLDLDLIELLLITDLPDFIDLGVLSWAVGDLTSGVFDLYLNAYLEGA